VPDSGGRCAGKLQFDFDKSKALRTRFSRRKRFIVVVTRCRQSSRRGVGWTTTTKSNDDDNDNGDNTVYFWTGIRQSGAAKQQL